MSAHRPKWPAQKWATRSASCQIGLHSQRTKRAARRRRAAATIDYFLIICIVLPLAAFILRIAPRIMQSVYDLLTVMVAWPFM